MTVPITIPSHSKPIRCGQCRIEQIKKRRQSSEEIVKFISGPFIVTIGAKRLVCNHSALILQNGTLFKWNKSIQIIVFQELYIPLLESSLKRCCTLHDVDIDGSDDYAVVTLPSDETKATTNSLSSFLYPSTIPLSATIRYKSERTLSILQQACLKRQLAGLHIVFQQGKFSSEIYIDLQGQTIQLHVETIISRSSDDTLIYIILPSTRITLLQSENVEEDKVLINLSQQNTLTPTAQILLQSARHLQTIQTIPKSFLLTGPPGVGKTFSVKQAHAALGGTLLVLQGSELLGRTGHAADAAIQLKDMFHECAINNDSTITWIFLDECDALLSSDVVAAMLGHLLDQLENHNIILVAATNRIDAVPSNLRRRMDQEIALEPPNATERYSLLHELLLPHDIPQLHNIATACIGYVAADLIALVRHARQLVPHNNSCTLSALHLYNAMHHVPASALRTAITTSHSTTTWDDICGTAGGAKTTLRRAMEWPHRTSFSAMGLQPPRGILLQGPPGCAKTSLAKAAAGASGMAFLSLSPADVYASSYVGDAEAVVRRAFTIARSAAPCILFFDEFDSILGCGGSMMKRNGMSTEGRVLSTFLNEMDGVDASVTDGVLVLGATNRPCQLDTALLRPGRFDNVIYVPPPDREGRRAILEMHCRKWKCTDMDFDKLCSDEISGMMTGAEVVGACREAAMLVLKQSMLNEDQVYPKVTHVQLETALQACKPLLSDPAVLEEYTMFERRRFR